MGRLLIFRPPQALRSGDDVLCAKTVAGLNQAGLSSKCYELSSQWWASALWSSRVPGGRTLFEYGPAFIRLLRHRRTIKDAAAVWVNGPSSPLNKSCWFEQSVIRTGKPYIYHLLDDAFSFPHLSVIATPRVRLASLIVVPTEPLKDRILGLFPDAKVLVLEEPIDVERLKPTANRNSAGLPFLVWTGHVASMADLKEYASILDKVNAKHPFKLRIICGQSKPLLKASFPWEWFPFNPEREAEYLSGATAGLAPLEDSPYARCKGGYKVKTYLAAGIPAIASPVGHHSKMIRSGENGILPATEDEWVGAISKLLADSAFARTLGKTAREYAAANYSHEVLMPIWAEKLRAAVPQLALENGR